MKNNIPIIAGLLLLLGCSQANQKEATVNNDAKADESTQKMTYKAKDEAKQDSTAPMSSIAARENKQDTIHKFIRTADIKFQVKNVVKSTYSIEDIVGRFGGFVTNTNLSSNIDRQTTIPVSADSTLESTYFTVVNTMTIRVPNTNLDSALKAISKQVDYMDYRVIKADDAGLQILANRLAQRRNNKYQQRLENDIDKKGRKLTETTNAEENSMNKQEQADNSLIANLSLADQIKYSTVSLNIYQKQEVHKILLANEKNIRSFEPSFGHKLIEALTFGWNAFEEILLFFVRIWWLILVGIAGYIAYRKLRVKTKLAA